MTSLERGGVRRTLIFQDNPVVFNHRLDVL